MTLKVTIFGVVHAHHVRWGVPKGLMENVVVDLGMTKTLANKVRKMHN